MGLTTTEFQQEDASADANTSVLDVLALPEVEVPASVPEAHRGEIVNVELHVAESGSCSFRVNLRSNDTGADDFLDVWLPPLFVENFNMVFDAASLPDDEGNRQRTSYRIGVSNSRKDAVIQTLRFLAEKDGRRFAGPAPSTIEEFVAAHNEMLQGLSVVYTKRPEQEKTKDGDLNPYAGRLRVKGIFSENHAFKPRALKRYKKMWEQ